MAANEHKNLSNANLHVPLNFSTADNSTVLIKNSVGDLEWSSFGTLKTHTLVLRGYCSPANSNYYYPANMDVNKDLEFTKDYTSATIDNATVISVSNMLRSSIFVVPADCTIGSVYGWVTGKDASETVTFALVKGSNVTADLATEFQVGAATNTMVILDEFTALTYNNNLKLGVIDNDSFVVNSLSKGDFLLPMIKHPSGANDTYFNMSIELRYSS
tara:strand:- start:1001 stop:1648 length:648 start_codon:yes stop_codon:yes gene_type:complete